MPPSAFSFRNSSAPSTKLLSAPISYAEIVIAYVGAAASKSVVLGLVILATASLFVPLTIPHPLLMAGFLVMTAVNFSLFGFILGLWAKGWEQLQLIPTLVVTPLTFLGGAFYSISMLPPAWRAFSLFNPVVYLISGFRWCFYGTADVNIDVSFGMTAGFFVACLARDRLDIQDGLPPEELGRLGGLEPGIRCVGAAPIVRGIERAAGQQVNERRNRQAHQHRDVGAAERARRPAPHRRRGR